MKNKLLITGGNGFLGRHCIRHFCDRGFKVHGIGSVRDTGEIPESQKQLTWHDVPVTRDKLLEVGSGFETIIHCAGGSSVARSLENPDDDYNNTVTTTVEVLEYMRQASPGGRLIYPSSAAVYGEARANRNWVGDPLNPCSPYGAHKQMVEEHCISYQRLYGLDVSIVRFFSIYGPGLRKQLIWDACHKLASASDGVEFWGTGEESRDWLYVSDAINLIHAVAIANDPPVILNGGTGHGITVRDVLITLASLLGIAEENVRFKGTAKKGDPSHYLADTKEANSLGWSATVDLRDGLNKYLDWFKGIEN